ncbi:uncharacterized protein LOC114326488 isoform X1 [Diabrotica virgifera virgifera]|uniref:Uncharacterized protein LOC114326488 isoform X1 n=1 Tax=Diabrotica virgifera virgifera TaxID=50390 RepID=A0A6P7FAV2_DIAVI|nr:uncharacterized protein LOC114326488 isoform X1 [Diabrotica virgifera virgifera]
MCEENWTKIIIPSGTVDPSKNAIIEIPINLKGSKVVVAKSTAGGGADASDGNGSAQATVETELEIMSEKEQEMIESILGYEEERERLVIAPVRQRYQLVDQMELVETGVIRKDISDFQHARRKLVFDVHGIISTLPDINKVMSRF